ncbi:MAG: SpoIVB peptidase [bacterium]|nr:SpoIVB peptidase [bacterium]MCM1376013.1 SpoIVB peptidase [Muribaculum sp.]
MWKKRIHFEDIDQRDAAIIDQAGADMAALSERWRKTRRRRRVFRCCLCVALVCACLTLGGVGYYDLYNQVPSVLRVKADMEQTIDLGVPLTGEVVSASGRDESNIPEGAVTIDLSRQVTMKMSSDQSYQMNVKLFGFLPFKRVGIQVIKDQELTPVGVPIGIYVKADGLLVVGVGEFQGVDGISYSPAKYVVKSGDYILQMDGQPVSDKKDFVRRVEECEGREVTLQIRRGNEIMEVQAQPEQNSEGTYKLGVWIRDNAQGVGTMTYIDANGNFGALGHGINDVDTSTLMSLDDGTLYQTEIIAIKKGRDGEPGEMTGMIVYSPERILGNIYYNGKEGIFGHCNEKALAMSTQEALPIGLKQDIERGPARILCSVDGAPRYYDVEITAIHLDHDNVNRGIELEVTDPELLALTGGIIQGMSGAPIIQNNHLIGAVTHVLVQDASRGYGIFIENMLEH